MRSVYLFFSSTQAIAQCTAQLTAKLPSVEESATPVLERALRRELGILCRFWATRQIWEHLDSNEADAKLLNVAVLRLFVDAFKLPRDGSGLRYAALATLADQTRELGQRMTAAIGLEHRPVVEELERAIVPLREALSQSTLDALELPVERLAVSVKDWTERTSY